MTFRDCMQIAAFMASMMSLSNEPKPLKTEPVRRISDNEAAHLICMPRLHRNWLRDNPRGFRHGSATAIRP